MKIDRGWGISVSMTPSPLGRIGKRRRGPAHWPSPWARLAPLHDGQGMASASRRNQVRTPEGGTR
jgi:hypothetical protein